MIKTYCLGLSQPFWRSKNLSFLDKCIFSLIPNSPCYPQVNGKTDRAKEAAKHISETQGFIFSFIQLQKSSLNAGRHSWGCGGSCERDFALLQWAKWIFCKPSEIPEPQLRLLIANSEVKWYILYITQTISSEGKKGAGLVVSYYVFVVLLKDFDGSKGQFSCSLKIMYQCAPADKRWDRLLCLSTG